MRRMMATLALLGLVTAGCGGGDANDAAPSGQVVGQPGETTTFAGIWPFATSKELDAYAAGSDRAYRDPVTTAREFAVRYLGMDNPVDFGFKSAGPGAGEVPMSFRYGEGRAPRPNPQPTFNVVLRQLGAPDASGPWTVVEATSPNIVVTTPGRLAKIGSPVRVTGQALAFEGTVNVAVREDGMLAGQTLGKGLVTGGGDVLRPYAGEVAFRSPTRPGGAVVMTDIGAADGQGMLRAAVVRVGF